jgi:hypothetical protein
VQLEHPTRLDPDALGVAAPGDPAAATARAVQAHGRTSRAARAAASTTTLTLAGFDEGPVPAAWEAELAARGVAVTREVLREEACAVLADYAAAEGVRY